VKLHVRRIDGGQAVFWLESAYTEREAAKAAGFLWHGGSCRDGCGACAAGLGKVWWTRRLEAARHVAALAVDDDTRAALAGEVAVPGAATARGPSSDGAALEAAIAAAPDDPQPYLVYADWLQQRGDPRGELIALDAAAGQDVTEARAALLETHAAALLGGAAAHVAGKRNNPLRLDWRLGHVRAARLDLAGCTTREPADEILRQLLALPVARLLEELTIGMVRRDGKEESDYDPLFAALAATPQPPPLRSLTVGDFQFSYDCPINWAKLGEVSRLWPRYPRLRSLVFQGTSLKLGAIQLPELRSFEARSGGLHRNTVQSIAGARWPLLERLVVWTGNLETPGTSRAEHLQPILDGVGLPRLRHLGIVNSQSANQIAAALATAKVLPQLETLDLSLGALTHHGVEALLGARGALRHLKQLNLSGNLIPERDCARLRDLCASVELGAQREPGENENGDTINSVAVSWYGFEH
jgi:uncharacterized protein (TIGR02996 family)